MLKIKQLFNINYHSYTYIIFSSTTSTGIIIDPIIEDVDKYIQLISELNINLYYIFETHLHADHITGAALLSKKNNNCPIVMGYETSANNVDIFISDDQEISIYDITIKAIHTPGHTHDSYCYLIKSYLFTGDTLLIRKTGRSDLQEGSARDQYQSIKNKLFTFPASTIIYPGHDYLGNTTSSIGEEFKYNTQISHNNEDDYIKLKESLELSPPTLMHKNLSANKTCGYDLILKGIDEKITPPSKKIFDLFKLQ